MQDDHSDPRYLTTIGNTLSEAIVPLRTAERGVEGTIAVASDRVNTFTLEDEAFLQRCAAAVVPLWTRGMPSKPCLEPAGEAE